MGTRHPNTSHDLLLLLHHLPGPHGAHDDCKYKCILHEKIEKAGRIFLDVLCFVVNVFVKQKNGGLPVRASSVV